ncbi:dipeptidase [Chloroflexus sp.]|uniref:dipeptidase n=1 Tax=Chloroflexus sp. TaxID=1904827 RepID=UPI002ACF0243|nr:dipeptidase [Chloroflexus sp.]
MNSATTALAYLAEHRARHLDDLCEFLSIPSVSIDPAHRADMNHAAEWLDTYLRQIGMLHTEIITEGGLPIVYSEWLGAAAAPTLLIYGHYDVQPADPLAEWRTPPFTPTIIGDNLYARGASDDKGQVMAVIAALAAWLQTSGRLPVNVKLLIEGEEEVSSTALHRFVATAAERLRCDAVLLVDSMMLSPQQPLILYGTRGNCYLEVTVRGPATDLHSGTFGGVVDNPFNVLVRLLAALQDGDTRRVLVPGFYHKVREVDDAEHALINQLPVSEQAWLALTGAPALAGESGFTALERASIRPTLDIHGIGGGFTGPGKKTVIPAQAAAKLSMRLAPNQDPHEIAELVQAFLQRLAPPSVTLTVAVLSASHPVLVDYRQPAVQAASAAFAAAFGKPATFSIGGGTLPIAATFQTCLRAPLIITGFGLPDDNLHAPNEKISLPCLFGGSEMVAHYLVELAAIT